ncbi:MAG: hypothetical protein C5B51_04630 [Terriglobia bacterium]|nr:MAG: hypothetical protein C5B51_04630 [Terriglobia bacterium]
MSWAIELVDGGKMRISASENKQFIRWAIEEIFNRKRTEMAGVFYEHDCRGNTPDGRYKSRDELTAILARYAVALPDSRMSIDCMIADGDRVIVHYTFTGTNTGPWAGLPATNHALRISGVMISRIQNNRIIQQDFVWDALDARRQLTAATTPRLDHLWPAA